MPAPSSFSDLVMSLWKWIWRSGKREASRTANLGVHQQKPLQRNPNAVSTRLQVDVIPLLAELAKTAWQSRASPSEGRFLLSLDELPAVMDEPGLQRSLAIMYRHARRWAPGLSVPFDVPRVRISAVIDNAGEFRVDSEGWVSITIAGELGGNRAALLTVLAHEACHHILGLSGLENRTSTTSNERKTDLAMFICGFGIIVENGRTQVTRVGNVYCTRHFGYLSDEEYRFAHAWVVSARSESGLSGVDRKATPVVSSTGFSIESHLNDLHRKLRQRVHNQAARDRLCANYAARFPEESEEKRLERILDDLMRDNR